MPLKRKPGDKRTTKTVASKRSAVGARKQDSNILNEPEVSYTSRIRPFGNSRGVILNNQVMETAGITGDADIIVSAKNGVIYIMELKTNDVNTDLSTWDKQFKLAIKKAAKPETDLFEGLTNEFDHNEW